MCGPTYVLTSSCPVGHCRYDASQGCSYPIVSNPALTVMKLFGMMTLYALHFTIMHIV